MVITGVLNKHNDTFITTLHSHVDPAYGVLSNATKICRFRFFLYFFYSPLHVHVLKSRFSRASIVVRTKTDEVIVRVCEITYRGLSTQVAKLTVCEIRMVCLELTYIDHWKPKAERTTAPGPQRCLFKQIPHQINSETILIF